MSDRVTAASGHGATYAQAVSAWAAHLRSGGTTTWSAWRRDHGGDRLDAHVLDPLPHASQLELVRRLNLAAGQGRGSVTQGPVLAELADHVLAAATPGRGPVDVPLPWEDATARFGFPAREPAGLPTEELLRLAVGVLTHRLPSLPPVAPGPSRTPWPLPWRRRFRLHGSPGTVAAVRSGLLAVGLVETARRPTHIVVARPLEVMMAEHWASSVRRGGISKWTRVWRAAQATGRLPPQIDVVALADRLAGRHREPLHVVVASDAAEVAALVAGLLGAPPLRLPPSGDAALPDLLRRVNRLTGLTGGPGQVRPLARALIAVLQSDQSGQLRHLDPRSGGPLTPRGALPWARRVTTTAAARVGEAGYAVHGDLDALAPTEHRLAGTVDRDRTLDLALSACLRAWHLGGNP